MSTRFRRAEPRDVADVEKLLSQVELPPLGPHPVLANLLLAERDDALVGAIALEVFGRSGVVRTVAVAPDARRSGIASELFRSLKARAHELSLKDLFVTPDGAGEFFAALGFAEAADDEVPLSIRQSGGESARWLRIPLR